jgi:ADP-heptose:LPS heptosyltransferase
MDLPRFVELLSAAEGVLSMDTAGAHIACALDKPTVIILGGGHYGVFGPWGRSERQEWITHTVPCLNCNWVCHRNRTECIVDITPTRIANAMIRVLSLSAAA